MTATKRPQFKDVRIELLEVAEKARALHAREKRIVVESIKLVWTLHRCNAVVNLGHFSSEALAEFIGLTVDQFWKRAMIGRTIEKYPKIEEMLLSGETKPSHVYLIAGRITEANSDILIEGLRGATTRQVRSLVKRTDNRGHVSDAEAELELTLRLSESQLALLDRAREVLSAKGKVPDNAAVMVKALEDLLEKRDPVKKAERAVARRRKAADKSDSPEETTGGPIATVQEGKDKTPQNTERKTTTTAPRQRQARTRRDKNRRPTIPAMVRHIVMLRDKGQCTHVGPDGKRCGETSMLELDHVQEYSRGGEDTPENLRLLCRFHNQMRAEQVFGREFMEMKRAAGS